MIGRTIAIGVMTAAMLMSLPAPGAFTAPISTTDCKAADDRTKTQNGKTYKCTSCQTCTTTTCETGQSLSCTKTTSTTCECTEVASSTRPGEGTVGDIDTILDPGGETRRPPRFGVPGGKLKQQ